MDEKLVLTAFPMESEIDGRDSEGLPIYDRAVGSGFYRTFWRKYFTDGIFFDPPDNFKVTPKQDMTVTVKLGECHIQGVTAAPEDKDELDIQLSEAFPSSDRTDRIVLRAEFGGKRMVYVAVREDWKQTDELTRTSNVWELAIADVVVKAGSSAVQGVNITDLRLNTALCGIVTEPFTRVNTDAFYSDLAAERENIKAQWAAAKQEQHDEWEEQLTNQKDDYKSFSDCMKGWYYSVRQDASKLQTFSFDNLDALAEAAKVTSFSGDTVTETIRNPYTQAKIAEKLTTFIGNNKINSETTVYDEDGTSILKQSVITTEFMADGSIKEYVTGFDDYTLNAAFVGTIVIDGGSI